MDLRIGEITAHELQPPGRLSKDSRPDAADAAKSFADYLYDAIGNVDLADKAAQDLGTAFALGEPVEVHEVMLAFSKAELGLRLFIELRNKVIEAYQEIMRMPV
jgi:flagellar hook-basal body complex protein FliE